MIMENILKAVKSAFPKIIGDIQPFVDDKLTSFVND